MWAQGSGGAQEKVIKVAGVRTVKPSDHDIREYAIWPQQEDEPEGCRR